MDQRFAQQSSVLSNKPETLQFRAIDLAYGQCDRVGGMVTRKDDRKPAGILVDAMQSNVCGLHCRVRKLIALPSLVGSLVRVAIGLPNIVDTNRLECLALYRKALCKSHC